MEFSPQVEVDLSKKTLKINNAEQPIEIKTGISDITNESEIYIGEEVFGAGFGLSYEWDEEYFGYKLSTDKELQIFLERRPKSVSAFSVQVKNVLEKFSLKIFLCFYKIREIIF